MIIYYNKVTGNIVGSTGGRTHQPEELKMWIGNPKEINRIVVEWKPVKQYTKEGHELPKECLDACDKDGNSLIYTSDFKPNCNKEQIPLFEQIEKSPMILHEKCKVDVSSGKLVEKTEQELKKEVKVKEEAKQRSVAKQKRKKELANIVSDKEKNIEVRFNALLEVLNLDLTFEKKP